MKARLIVLALLFVLIAVTACQQYEEWGMYDPFESPIFTSPIVLQAPAAAPEPVVESAPRVVKWYQVCDWMGCRWFVE